MLQIKEIPPRPTEYDGLLCLGGVPTGTNAAKIMELLQQFGEIEHCTPPEQSITVYRVKFKAHAAAERAADEAPKMKGLCATFTPPTFKWRLRQLPTTRPSQTSKIIESGPSLT